MPFESLLDPVKPVRIFSMFYCLLAQFPVAPDHLNAARAATGSSPTKSVATASYFASRLGKGINWNIGAFDTGTTLIIDVSRLA